MPLPLPNLDTRRWADLIDEGRALIPRYAPTWTDHNVHDPGITLMETLAWLVEQDIYRANRVPDRHRRKFLALAGFPPAPPQPARLPLTFALAGAGPVALPSGVVLSTGVIPASLRFHTLAPLTVLPVQLKTVQSFDGGAFLDETRRWREGLPVALWGENPASAGQTAPAGQPALYLGLEFDLSVVENQSLSLWLRFGSGRSDSVERARIQAEAEASIAACRPPRPLATCPPAAPSVDPWCALAETADEPVIPAVSHGIVPPHPTVRAVWEYDDGAGWQLLDAKDETRSLTLDGALTFTVPSAWAKRAWGVVKEAAFYLRCRLVAGLPDIAPVLADWALNTVLTEQVSPVRSTLPIAPEVTLLGETPTPGTRQQLALQLNAAGQITSLAIGPAVVGPAVWILDYQPAAPATPGSLTATLVSLGAGTGLPGQRVILPDAPVASGQLDMWSFSTSGGMPWRQVADFDAATATDAVFTLDPTNGTVMLGDGEKGRIPPVDATLIAVYATTAGAAGNVAAGAIWRLSGADDALNGALLGSDFANVIAALGPMTNRFQATEGADAEELMHAAGRAAENLWAHERLIELCPAGGCDTLDQLDHAAVLSRIAPPRATTLLDYERLALDTPGIGVLRARAWAGLDPTYPSLRAPGTVTVIVVPGLPVGQPQPSQGMLDSVHSYLNRRRTIGTRLVVVGPQYVEVTVQATVQAKARTSPARVQADIIAGLNAFLDPLQGGPNQRGWPFGRDVYRAEILQVIDNVPGVDHVLSLELIAGNGAAQCGNLCVGPTWLVTPGRHEIVVQM